MIENSIKIYENKDIFILQYPKGNDISFSIGKIISIINDKKIIHNCSTEGGSSGSPMITRNSDNSIIGLHKGSFSINNNSKYNDNKDLYNMSTSIISTINDIKNNIT